MINQFAPLCRFCLNRRMTAITRLRSCSALATAAILLILVAPACLGQETKLPPLAEIKAAAENGDPVAQDRLGSAYFGGFNFSQAEYWYRKAAEAGISNSQWQLGMIYLSGKPKMQGERAVAQNEREAVRWLSRAANQGNVRAQIDMGHCYANGKAVQRDVVESYKWYSLAAKHDEILGRMYRDSLILKMSSEQIAEGQRRMASFRVSRDKEVQLPKPSPQIVLKGIAGFKNHRQAIINGRAFGVGDEQEVVAGGRAVKVRCVEIREKSVLITVDGGEGKEIGLRRPD